MDIRYNVPSNGEISFLDNEIPKATVLVLSASCKHIDTQKLELKARNVVSVEVSKENRYFEERDGVLFSKGMTELVWYPPCKEDAIYYIPGEVKTLKTNSIHNAYLKKLAGGNGLTRIEKSFCGIGTLVTIDEFCIQNDSFSSSDGALYKYDYSELIACPITKKCNLERTSLKVIKSNALAMNASVTDVILHDNLQIIEAGAFLASGITSITGGYGLQSIGVGAFADCKKLEAAVFQEGLKAIETGAFNHCQKLHEIMIPKSVRYIGYDRSYSTFSKKTTILCERGFVAAEYAMLYGIPFKFF